MKFLLSELVRARFPDPLALDREVLLPNDVRGRIKHTDGLTLNIEEKPCVNLVYWIMYDKQMIPVDQVHVLFEPGIYASPATPLSDDAIERFRIAGDLTYEGLRRAVFLPDEPRPPSRLAAPKGCDVFQAYFQRHEPYCHAIADAHPDVMWRAFFLGGIPTEFKGFQADYQESQLSKMASHHAAVPPENYDEYAKFLTDLIPPPSNLYLWMADYARRRGLRDAVSFIDGDAITQGLLTLQNTTVSGQGQSHAESHAGSQAGSQGQSHAESHAERHAESRAESQEESQAGSRPRYAPRVMSKLMANPSRQLTALVLFALTEGESRAWPKHHGFDRWLYTSYAEL
jgi:hypothetical protein